MVKYNAGKIYKIEPICEHDEGDIYIGSTSKNYLSQRMVAHRNDYNRYKSGKRNFVTSFELFEKYGIENCNIILLETVNANSKDELRSREGHYIKTLKCVNMNVAGRTYKEYEQEHVEYGKERQRVYYQYHNEETK